MGCERIERAYGQLAVSFNVVFDPQSFGTGAAAREVPGWYSYQMSEHQVGYAPAPLPVVLRQPVKLSFGQLKVPMGPHQLNTQ